MSEKELLYVEDALNQTLLLQTKCKNYANMMQDRELKAYCKELETRAEEIYLKIFKVLQ
ncbi:MAG TPA: hypothetical protein GX692_09155 [Acholeplasmataceae bacterium]|jgi:hypothetical protein|nr:hypothetical protein [Acholeplasmataceae bacterium]